MTSLLRVETRLCPITDALTQCMFDRKELANSIVGQGDLKTKER